MTRIALLDYQDKVFAKVEPNVAPAQPTIIKHSEDPKALIFSHKEHSGLTSQKTKDVESNNKDHPKI